MSNNRHNCQRSTVQLSKQYNTASYAAQIYVLEAFHVGYISEGNRHVGRRIYGATGRLLTLQPSQKQWSLQLATLSLTVGLRWLQQQHCAHASKRYCYTQYISGPPTELGPQRHNPARRNQLETALQQSRTACFRVCPEGTNATTC